MLRRLHRLTASILLPLFVLQSTGCTHVVKKPVAEVTPTEKDQVVGVTTLAGRQIKFDGAGTVRDDTVHALSDTHWIIVPVDSVGLWWLDKPNPVAVGAALVLGSAAVVLVMATLFAESLEE